MWFSTVFCFTLLALVSCASLEQAPKEIEPVQQTEVLPGQVENKENEEQARDKRFLFVKKYIGGGGYYGGYRPYYGGYYGGYHSHYPSYHYHSYPSYHGGYHGGYYGGYHGGYGGGYYGHGGWW